MTNTHRIINADLVCINLYAENWEEVLDELSHRLLAQGVVRDTFVEAVKQRERQYPTGLPTQEVGVAIPHADPQHVLVPAAALATLVKPVRFRLMENPEEEVDVELVIMLAVRDTKEHVGVLQRLVDAFQAPGFLRKLKAQCDPVAAADMLARIMDGRGLGGDPNDSGTGNFPGGRIAPTGVTRAHASHPQPRETGG